MAAGAEGPQIAYLSQITDRVDFELLEKLAARHPSWQIIMIGPVVCPEKLIRPLRRYPNIHFMGQVPYRRAARMVASCDICILPHRKDRLTETLDPIKLYDYLATGRPVVSTDVAMHPEIRALIRVAPDNEAFEREIQSILNSDRAICEKQLAAARRHSWPQRAKQALSFLEPFFHVDSD